MHEDWYRGAGGSREHHRVVRSSTTAFAESEDSVCTSDRGVWGLDRHRQTRGGAWLRSWRKRNAVDWKMLNVRDALGRGALHWACLSGSVELVEVTIVCHVRSLRLQCSAVLSRIFCPFCSVKTAIIEMKLPASGSCHALRRCLYSKMQITSSLLVFSCAEYWCESLSDLVSLQPSP